MLGTGWTEAVALAAAFLIAVLATPAGVPGAVLLLPFQVSVLGTPSPAVTPTNLLYNVVAAPGRCTATGGRGRPAGRWPAADRRDPAGRGRRVRHPGPVDTGARIQSRLPDVPIRRLVGLLVVAIAGRYLRAGLA